MTICASITLPYPSHPPVAPEVSWGFPSNVSIIAAEDLSESIDIAKRAPAITASSGLEFVAEAPLCANDPVSDEFSYVKTA